MWKKRREKRKKEGDKTNKRHMQQATVNRPLFALFRLYLSNSLRFIPMNNIQEIQTFKRDFLSFDDCCLVTLALNLTKFYNFIVNS